MYDADVVMIDIKKGVASAMARKTGNQKNKKDNSFKAGIIAYGATLLGYASIFPFHRLSHWVIGIGLSLAVGTLVKIMASPMKGLDKAKNSSAAKAIDTDNIQDEYARTIVEKGIENMNQLRLARDAVNEYVFTRRINQLSVNFRKLLEQVQADPDKASRLRKLNTYYMPTCVKLLNAYREAKAQGTTYQQISATREDILNMLDRLLEATQALYDDMIQDNLTDMDIEIDVFEQMLRNDGMIVNPLTEDLKTSAAAAARQEQSAPTQSAPVETATATAQQLQHGAPVLEIPESETFDSFYSSSRSAKQ